MSEYDEFERRCFEFLVKLRDSGVTNMWGASPYLQAEFQIGPMEAGDITDKWMKSFKEEDDVTAAEKAD